MKILFITLLILAALAQQPPENNHKIIELDQSYNENLTSQSNFTAKYQINILQDQVKKVQITQWYLFIDVQPVQQLAWESIHIKLFVSDKSTNFMPLKQCWNKAGVASCFVASNSFNYTKSKIHAQVICKEACQYKISAQVSSVYPLTPNEKLDLDFEGTAYTKLFSIDTNNFDKFQRLQIILKPNGFLSFNQPIKLYVNNGQSIPTRQKHDYSGMHLWDDGKGVFINYPMARNKFTILVQGPQKNILSLRTNIVKQDSIIQPILNEPTFTYIQSQTVRSYKIKVDKNTKNCIKLTTISGAVQLFRVLDQDKKQINQEFTSLSRTYGQLQYKITPQFFKINSNSKINDFIFVEIKGLKQSTFVFQFYYDNQSISHLIPEVNKYAELSSNDTDQYYIELVELKQSSTNMKGQTIIEVITTTYQQTKLKTKFYICKKQKIQECSLNSSELSKARQNKPLDSKEFIQVQSVTKDDQIQGVVYYSVQLNYSSFKLLDNDIMKLYIVVILTNQEQQQILYTLQYVDIGKTYYLKEKQSKKDRISIDQFKYYRYLNTDPDVVEIKVHVVQISGEVLMQGFHEDPRATNQEGKQIYQYHNTLTFNKQNLTQIYVQVQGLQNAYYSLYLQLIRKSQQKIKPKNNTGFNELIILQNTQYQFLIKPKEKMIFQIHSKTKHFVIFLQALLPLDLCMTQKLQSPPFQPNCEITLSVAKKQHMTIDMDKGLVGNMGVTNNNDNIVNFKLRISSQMAACQKKQLGKLYKYSPISNKNNQTESFVCSRYTLNKIDSVEVIVQLLNSQYQTTEIQLKINDKLNIQMLSPRHTIKKQQLQKICNLEQTKCRLWVQVKTKQPTEVDIIVQYNHGQIVLVDGLAHPVRTTNDPKQSKHFIYTLYNKVNTTIMLQNIDGYYKFYGKVVDKQSFQIDKAYPSEKDYLFSSANPFYYNYQMYILTEKQIKNISCEECLLLISVYVNQTYYNQITAGRFMIQCTQQDRFLKQNEPIMGYLQAKSITFYQYYNYNEGSIFININNHNKNCSKVYVKKGNEARASGSDYDISSQQNSVIVDNSVVGPYSITIQAKTHCPYNIQVFSSKSKIAKLKAGIFNDITLNANEQANFLYQNYSNKTFKVFALNKLGELMMQIKKIQSSQLDKILQDLQKNNTVSYDLTNMDFLRVDQNGKEFCVNCTYFINIVADKYTQSSIVIPTDNIQVPIAKDSFVKDIVKLNQSSLFRIFTESIAQFEIYVQYGKINVTITQSSDNKTILNKVYESTKEPQYEKFQIQKDQYDFLRYSIVNITALQNSYYSFSLISSKDQQQRGNNVKPGIPEYFYLQKNIGKCFKGTLQDPSEQFIISFESVNVQTIKKTNITCKINNKTVQFKQTLGVNQLILQLVNATDLSSKSYELCLISNDQSTSLTFIQSSRIIYLPESTSIFAHHPFNFTFGPRGKAILQVDECKERVKTLISTSFINEQSLNTQISQIRKANNIIQFQYYGPVYMHVETTGARIRWRSKDQYSDVGVGYDKFTSGRAFAYKNNNQSKLILKISPIKKIDDFSKQTTISTTNIEYFIYFSKNESQLNAGMNCQQGDFITYSYKLSPNDYDKPFQYKVDISLLKQKFLSEKYFLAGVMANMNIEVNKILQVYRFIYPFVDIQREVLLSQQQIKEQTKEQGFFASFISFLSIAIFILLIGILLFFCYRNCLSKILRRNKKGRLSDQGTQNFKYTQFSSMG